MFTCTACFRRALRNLATELPPDALIHSRGAYIRPSSHRVSKSHGRIPERRTHATLSSMRQGHHRRDLINTRGKWQKGEPSPTVQRRKARGALSPPELRDAQARAANQSWMRRRPGKGEGDGDEDDLIPPSQLKEPSKYEVEESRKSRVKLVDDKRQDLKLAHQATREVQTFFQDPLKLANGVLQRLRVPDLEGALRLVRASEQFEISNIVSWNHCMDWMMSQGDTKGAIKIYNEMKKRGKMPDSYTYTIMLRGLSQHVHKPGSVQEAVKIYNSIFAPNSSVQPNTIHTNAIINVCARGGDLDSMWAIAGKLPEKGSGSPDRLTYTLILNAIRDNTIKEVAKAAGKKQSEGDFAATAKGRSNMFDKAVSDGRKLWEDVSFKWRRADLVIDEQLVCAMGRLLLGCGVHKDIEQVLDLVESTMRVRIMERKSAAKKPGPFNSGAEEAEPKSMLPLKESNVYATPGENTLSMLLEACQQHAAIRHFASSYWDVLTAPDGHFKIRPDATNIMAYLRVLRMNRSSARVYDVLSQEWPPSVAKSLYRRGTFVIAFATCARDKNNPNVFATAQKLVKLMQEKLEEKDVGMFDNAVALGQMNPKERKSYLTKQKAMLKELTDEELAEHERSKDGVESLPVDPKILQYFVQLAVDTTKGWNEGVRGKDDGEVFDRHATKNNTLVALRTAAPLTGQLKRLLKVKLDEMQYPAVRSKFRGRGGNVQVAEKVEEMMSLMRVLIGAYDRVIETAERFKRGKREGLDEALMADFNSKKREYTAYMARVQVTMAKTLRNAQSYEPEEEDDLEVKEGEGAEQVPDIERRINAVLSGVDSKILRGRAAEKGFRNPKPVSQDDETALKIHSRRQNVERRDLLKKEMSRKFGKTDYGVLNENLEIETGPFAEQKQAKRDRHQQQTKWRMGDDESGTGSFSPQGGHQSSEPAQSQDPSTLPQRKTIAEVLGMETDAEGHAKLTHTRPSPPPSGRRPAISSDPKNPPRWWSARDKVTEKAGADWLLKLQRGGVRSGGVLGDDSVRRTWEGNRAARVGAAVGR